MLTETQHRTTPRWLRWTSRHFSGSSFAGEGESVTQKDEEWARRRGRPETRSDRCGGASGQRPPALGVSLAPVPSPPTAPTLTAEQEPKAGPTPPTSSSQMLGLLAEEFHPPLPGAAGVRHHDRSPTGSQSPASHGSECLTIPGSFSQKRVAGTRTGLHKVFRNE